MAGSGGRPGPPESLAADLELAERLAQTAGRGLIERFRGPARGVERKSTETDLVSEAEAFRLLVYVVVVAAVLVALVLLGRALF